MNAPWMKTTGRMSVVVRDPDRKAVRPRADRGRLDAVSAQDGRGLSAVFVAVVHQLREHRADGRVVSVDRDLAVGIVGRGHDERARAGRGRDGGELVELMPLVAPDARAVELTCDQPDVPLLAADEMLQRPVERPVRAQGLVLEPCRIQGTAEVEERAV